MLKRLESQSLRKWTEGSTNHGKSAGIEVCKVNWQFNDAGGNVGNDEKELIGLQNEVATLKDQKHYLEGKLNMVYSELSTTKVSLERMKTWSKTLDEILSKQKLDKRGIGYVDGAFTSNSKANAVFVKGPIQNENTPIVPTITLVNHVQVLRKGMSFEPNLSQFVTTVEWRGILDLFFENWLQILSQSVIILW